MKVKKLYITALGTFFISLLAFNVSAQQYKVDSHNAGTDAIDFVLFVEKNDNTITLKCTKGCDWGDLKLDVKKNQILAIDEFGVKNGTVADNRKGANLADFLISVERVANGINLKGIQGTNWTDLNFDFKNQRLQGVSNKGLIRPE